MRLIFLSVLICFSLHAESGHQVHLESGTIHYTAEVGSIICKDSFGQEKGSIYYTYYRKEDEPLRPITFAFNGGPGCSSVYLHLGAFGPKRLASSWEGQTPLPPYRWVDNTDSILDLTDLVFIDPIGTGFSRAVEQDTDFYGIVEDIVAVGDFIFDFIAKEGR